MYGLWKTPRTVNSEGHDGDQSMLANLSLSGLMSEPRYYLGTLGSFLVLGLSDALDADALIWR